VNVICNRKKAKLTCKTTKKKFTWFAQLSVIVILHMCVCFLSIAQCLREQQMYVGCFLFFLPFSFFFLYCLKDPLTHTYTFCLMVLLIDDKQRIHTRIKKREETCKGNIYIYIHTSNSIRRFFSYLSISICLCPSLQEDVSRRVVLLSTKVWFCPVDLYKS
jgi:hypothetical protein